MGKLDVLTDMPSLMVLFILGFPVQFALTLIVLYLIIRYAFHGSVLVSILTSIILGSVTFFVSLAFF